MSCFMSDRLRTLKNGSRGITREDHLLQNHSDLGRLFILKNTVVEVKLLKEKKKSRAKKAKIIFIN